ncbi:hypothetical protein JCM9533A_22980 [Catenuloplanes niger JCM 9533]
MIGGADSSDVRARHSVGTDGSGPAQPTRDRGVGTCPRMSSKIWWKTRCGRRTGTTPADDGRARDRRRRHATRSGGPTTAHRPGPDPAPPWLRVPLPDGHRPSDEDLALRGGTAAVRWYDVT